ncbi:helix-turn-helix domain-containing protein [Marinobacterium ramblicola]|uniref:helix-turn-helix domain-containing protein n=1 Tax=Marinobacterium ramblicola TaxID=2849041 RepID=UPI001FE59D6D|nr:helix-turn-helix domain-containing protein [Marinobacterium ramblicola]
MDTTASVMTLVADAVFGGAEGFTRFLGTSFSVGASEQGERRLNRFYKAFYRVFEDGCFDPYKHLLEQYLNQHWPEALSRRNSLFKDRTIQSHPWLALQAACRKFAVPKSHIRTAIAGDDVRSMSVQGPKRESVLVWKPDVLRLKERLADSLTAKDAADYLGVTKKQFGQLRQSGYFRHQRAPGSASRCVWAFSKDELSRFLTSLVHSSSAPPEAMTLSQVLRRFRAGVKEPLVIIIEAIKQGSLGAYASSPKPTIRELVFDSHQFEDWYRERSSDSELFSITEAAKHLGIHQEFAYQLVNAGLLETDHNDTQLGRLVSQHAIDKFRSEYVLLRDLAREAGRSSASVMSDLASRGISPVDADWNQQLRQKVYLASEILL